MVFFLWNKINICAGFLAMRGPIRWYLLRVHKLFIFPVIYLISTGIVKKVAAFWFFVCFKLTGVLSHTSLVRFLLSQLRWGSSKQKCLSWARVVIQFYRSVESSCLLLLFLLLAFLRPQTRSNLDLCSMHVVRDKVFSPEFQQSNMIR